MDCDRRRYKYSSNLVCKEGEGEEVGEKVEKRKREEDGVGGNENGRRNKHVLEEHEEDKGRGTENGSGSKEGAEEHEEDKGRGAENGSGSKEGIEEDKGRGAENGSGSREGAEDDIRREIESGRGSKGEGILFSKPRDECVTRRFYCGFVVVMLLVAVVVIVTCREYSPFLIFVMLLVVSTLPSLFLSCCLS